MNDLVADSVDTVFGAPAGGTLPPPEDVDGPGVGLGTVLRQGALFGWPTVAGNVDFGLRRRRPPGRRRDAGPIERGNPRADRVSRSTDGRHPGAILGRIRAAETPP